ncbi:MAG: type I-E CRISPR-associated protein Cas6/Cse3/CasE [Clostridia bacterium]|nr:type I-E CRISPR-associated protein Cas6/Cse3/CasE [Clostridia bacterium]
MYMTRMELDTARRATVLALASPNLLHGAIEAAFPGERKRRLWRVDPLNGRQYLLIVSEDRPDLTAACAQFGMEGGSWETRDYAPFLSRIEAGSCWHFRLAANPTVSKAHDQGERGRVYAHVTADQQKKWLLSRAEKHGFCLEGSDFDIVSRGVITFNKGADRRRVTLGVCTFEGILRVSDAERFRAALTEGIGRGKAYGVGLLTIA